MGKKIIGISVWGTETKYTNGALENIKLQKKFYPDFITRLYVANNVPAPMVEAYDLYDCEVVKIDRDGNKDGLFWRFYPAWDKDMDVFIVRDADSRIMQREVDAVNEWLASDKVFHVMRDNPSHSTVIMGGLWGAKKGFMPNFKQELDAYVSTMQPTPQANEHTQYFNSDQQFLNDKVWPVVKNKCMAHDEFHHFTGMEKPFPTEREGNRFVGE